MIPLGHATVYQGSATHSWAYPAITLSVAIDTDAHIWTATWHASSYLLDPPSICFDFSIKFKDNKGFSQEYSSGYSYSGTITIEDYTNTNTWTHTHAQWAYFFPLPWGFGMVFPELWIDLYIGSSGSGCPTLSVFDGLNYVTEGLLDIHNPDGTDVVYDHTLTTEPAWTKGRYEFRLKEHQNTHSYIDQVKLYAMLEDGTKIELPLTYAWHSEDGNVLPQLLFSDEWKTDTLGANLNNGKSQSIDLKFASPPNLQVVSFIFQIEGNNRITKR